MLYYIKKILSNPIIIKYAFGNLVSFIYYTAKPKFFNPLSWVRLLNEKNSKRKLKKNKELWNYIIKAMKESDSTGCEFSDYYFLYKSILSGKYKSILELGSGISSIVIAYASKQLTNKGYNKPLIISMEENLDYHNQIKKIIPEDLIDSVQFVHSNRKEQLINDILICNYEAIPLHNYDFVFVDGPSLIGSNGKKSINGDLIIIIEQTKNLIIDVVVDQRLGTFNSYKKIFSSAKSYYNPILKLGFIKMEKAKINYENFNGSSLWWTNRSLK